MKTRRVSSGARTSSNMIFIALLAVLASALIWLDFKESTWIQKIHETRLMITSAIISKTHDWSHSIVKNFYHYAAGSRDINALEVELAETNNRASILSLYMQAIIQENNQLKQLLHYVASDSDKRDFQHLATRVLHRTSGISSSIAYIPIGSDDGIAIGQAVINEKGLVGKILKVVPKGAEILLINDSRFSMPVIMRDSGEHAMFHGSGLSFSHKQPKVFDGEMAMTLGDNKSFPGRLPVGIVKITEGKVALTTRIDPFVDTAKLDYVLVITRSNEK